MMRCFGNMDTKKKRTKRISVTASPGYGLTTFRSYGCTHYARRCAYVSPCCGKIYSCRVCHDDKEDHKIDRFSVMQVQCTICNTKQGIHQTCEVCGVLFGRYFCATCRMFDDEDKQQYHCDKCGLCRVGGRENYFHCDKCDMCLCILLKDSHTCVEKVTHSDCPVCLDDLHTAREMLHILSCGHVTHESCWIDMLKAGNYSCPLCGHTMLNMETVWKRLDDEIANSPMPENHLQPLRVWILCRDCHQKAEVKFHRLGLKCITCGSYNTCRCDPVLPQTYQTTF